MEIIRRTPDISEEEMIESLHAAAEDGFLRLDAEEEARNADPQSPAR